MADYDWSDHLSIKLPAKGQLGPETTILTFLGLQKKSHTGLEKHEGE